MPYLGNQPASIGSYLHQTFAGDGSAVDFTLSRAAATNTIIVSIDGVDQIPTTAYSVISGTTLRFTAAPPNSTPISVRHLGDQVDFGEPSDGSVTQAKLASDIAFGTITTQNNFFKNWNAVTSTQTTTIAASENAGIIGPITVNSGVTWTINGTLRIL